MCVRRLSRVLPDAEAASLRYWIECDTLQEMTGQLVAPPRGPCLTRQGAEIPGKLKPPSFLATELRFSRLRRKVHNSEREVIRPRSKSCQRCCPEGCASVSLRSVDTCFQIASMWRTWRVFKMGYEHYMNGRVRHISCCVLLISWCVHPRLAVGDDADRSSLQEAQRAWAHYAENMLRGHYEIEGTLRHENQNTGEVISESAFTNRICGEYASAAGDSEFGSSQVATVVNPSYQFRATRSSDSQWQSEEYYAPLAAGPAGNVNVPPDDPVFRRGSLPSPAHTSVMKALCRGLMLWENWFPAMTQSTDFDVTSFAQVKDDGRDLVKIEFTYSPQKWQGNVPRDGWVLLDPKMNWLIVEAETAGEWGDGAERGVMRVRNTYDEWQIGIPLVSNQQIVIRVPEDGSATDDMWTRNYYKVAEIECHPEEYMLAAFGLMERPSEVGRPVVGSRRTMFLILGNVLVLTAIGFYAVLRWRSSRSRSRRSEK